MVEITLQVSESLAERLQAMRDQLPEILELGLQRHRPLSNRAYVETLEFLATAPTPEEILMFHPSTPIQAEVKRLMSKLKDETITPEEEAELDRIGDLEHILLTLKARAKQQLDLDSVE